MRAWTRAVLTPGDPYMRTPNDKIVKVVHEQVQVLLAGLFALFTPAQSICGKVAAFSITVECCLVQHFECQKLMSMLDWAWSSSIWIQHVANLFQKQLFRVELDNTLQYFYSWLGDSGDFKNRFCVYSPPHKGWRWHGHQWSKLRNRCIVKRQEWIHSDPTKRHPSPTSSSQALTPNRYVKLFYSLMSLMCNMWWLIGNQCLGFLYWNC